MQSEAGVRFELRREESGAEAVRYELRLELGSDLFTGTATIQQDSGSVAFQWNPGVEPPAWCVAAIKAQLRLLYRDRATTPFPRRVTRWRPAPS